MLRAEPDQDMVVSRCTRCGAELQAGFRFCPTCGQAVASTAPAPTPSLRWLPFVFAAGAVFWLIELVQFAAVVAAPAGREQLQDSLRQAGLTGDITTLLVLDAAIVFFIEGTAAALHSAAYFGLKARKPWGWVTAVVVSALWSLVLIGIPVLVVLLRRNTRLAYGIR